MDLKKCRTCFGDLEETDLYQKLSAMCRTSGLSVADKLKTCVPVMDLRDIDCLYMCMQCSMNLETAFSFRKICLEAEDRFQDYLKKQDGSDRSRRAAKRGDRHYDEEDMRCGYCNINFSSRNIYELHMKVMHIKAENDERNIRENSVEDKKSIDVVTVRDEGRPQRRRTSSKRKRSSDSVTSGSRSTPSRSEIAKKPSAPPNKKTEKSAPSKTDEVKRVPARCPICGKHFQMGESAMRSHLLAAHKDKCVSCIICSRYYTNKKIHQRRYGCQFQNLPLRNTIDVISHFQTTSGKLLYYIEGPGCSVICMVCRRKCKGMPELEKHIPQHTYPVCCHTCRSNFSAFKYTQHVSQGCPKLFSEQLFSQTSDDNWICPICNLHCPNREALGLHLPSHMFRELECQNCSKVFTHIGKFCEHTVICGKVQINKVEMPEVTHTPEGEYEAVRAIESETPKGAKASESEIAKGVQIPASEWATPKAVKVEPTELSCENTYEEEESQESRELEDVSDTLPPLLEEQYSIEEVSSSNGHFMEVMCVMPDITVVDE